MLVCHRSQEQTHLESDFGTDKSRPAKGSRLMVEGSKDNYSQVRTVEGSKDIILRKLRNVRGQVTVSRCLQNFCGFLRGWPFQLDHLICRTQRLHCAGILWHNVGAQSSSTQTECST